MKKIVFLFTMLFAFCVLVACGEGTGTPTPSTYRITFDSDGGSKVEAIVGEAGIEIAAPTDPTKEGYKFLGWYLNDVEYEFTVMPEINITLVAKWEEVETPEPGPDPVVTYTLTFDVNGGNALAENSITGEAGTAITLPVPTKEGYTFLGWYNGEVKFEETTMPSENITLVAKWEEVETPEPGPDPVVTFTITFDVNGGNALAENSITGEAGTAVELPVPTREGYTFLGWLYEGELFETTSMPDFSLTLVASWEIIPAKTVKVVYNLNGGYTEYADLAAVKAAFDVDYKALSGQTTYSIWHHYEELANVFTQTNGKWNWLLDYWAAVNSNSYSGVTNASQFLKVKNGEKIDDYYFFGVEITSWYTSDLQSVYGGGLKSADYSDPAVQLRMWEFLSNYQTGKEYELHLGDALLDKIYKVGYEFGGWYLDEGLNQEATTVTEDATLYAKWNKVEHTLTYVLNNNDASIANTTVKFSAIESIELLQPTYDVEKYKFLGWFTDEALTTPIEQIKLLTDKDVTVYASWKAITGNEFEVKYVLNEGNWYFSSHDELVTTFISEYNEITDRGVAADTFYSKAANYTHVFFDNQDMFAKWSWLFEYFYALGEEGYGKHSESQAQYQTFLAGNGSTVSVQWAVRQNIQGFLSKTHGKLYSTAAAIDFTNSSLVDRFWTYLNASQITTYEYESETELPQPKRQFHLFKGWYDNAEFNGEAYTKVSGETTLYAKWEEETPVTSVVITNKFEEANCYSTLQLEYTLAPAEAMNRNVAFSSSDTTVATVDENGLVTMVGLGTATITITSLSSSRASDSVSFNVVEPGHFNASYETNSYVAINGEIKLLAEYINKSQEQVAVTWSSLNSDIATVNDGVVTGVKEGVAKIRATANDETFDFVVTVLPANLSAALQHAVNSHESNVFIKYDLPIGYPKSNQGYYKDVISSVSKLLYNHDLVIDDAYLEAGNATGAYYTNSTVNEGLQFITVHYTGTFATTADTDNIARNFTSSGTEVSIHYVTGNKGVLNGEPSSEVYHTLDHAHGAYHAGDSNSRYHSNSTKENSEGQDVFEWMPTGVAYDDCNLLDVKFSASDDFYYEINGKKTSIKLPTTWNHKERNTDHIYNADGTISAQPDYSNWGSTFSNRTPESFFNDQGFPVKIINGEYYMGPTWWSYGQVYEGRICALGGNKNSIGIESCVNEGSDVWYTWQVTAQLVAKLMKDNDLGIERVKGHHFYDGKDCPQPLLENDLEIWNMFIDMVLAEYELLTTYKDVEYQFATVEEYDFVSENGRITEQPEFTQVVQYTVTVGEETITLASIVEGIYNK